MPLTLDGTGSISGLSATGISTVQTIPSATITQAMLQTAVVPLGVGQTWQSVVGSRAFGVTFTNSTGRSIMVSMIATRINTTTLTAVVAGITVAQEAGTGASANANTTLCFIVPDGAPYSVSTAGGSTVGFWAELR